MPIYPPRNTTTKKKQILNYKIFEFKALLDLDEPTVERINKKAEEVRIAMLNLIKAKIALNKTYNADDENETSIQLREKLSLDKTNWQSYTFDDIRNYCIRNRKDK